MDIKYSLKDSQTRSESNKQHVSSICHIYTSLFSIGFWSYITYLCFYWLQLSRRSIGVINTLQQLTFNILPQPLTPLMADWLCKAWESYSWEWHGSILSVKVKPSCSAAEPLTPFKYLINTKLLQPERGIFRGPGNCCFVCSLPANFSFLCSFVYFYCMSFLHSPPLYLPPLQTPFLQPLQFFLI